MTVPEAAKLLFVSEAHVQRLAEAGELTLDRASVIASSLIELQGLWRELAPEDYSNPPAHLNASSRFLGY